MSVLVRIGRHKAILRMGQWVSANRHTETLLNETTSEWVRQTGGPPLSHPDHERCVAEQIAGQLGGRVMLRMKPVTRRAVRVWVAHRQLKLF